MTQYRGRQAKRGGVQGRAVDMSGAVSKIYSNYQENAAAVQQQINRNNELSNQNSLENQRQTMANLQLMFEQQARAAEWKNRLKDQRGQAKLDNARRLNEQRINNANVELRNQDQVGRMQMQMQQDDVRAVTELGKTALGFSKSLWEAEANRINEENYNLQVEGMMAAQADPSQFQHVLDNMGAINNAKVTGLERTMATADAFEKAGLQNDANHIRNSNKFYLYGVQEGLAQAAASDYPDYANRKVVEALANMPPGADPAMVEADALREARRDFFQEKGLVAINPAVVHKYFHRQANAADMGIRARGTQERTQQYKAQLENKADNDAYGAFDSLEGMLPTERVEELGLQLREMAAARGGDLVEASMQLAKLGASKILAIPYDQLDRATALEQDLRTLFQGQAGPLMYLDAKLDAYEEKAHKQYQEQKDTTATQFTDSVIADIVNGNMTYEDAQERLAGARDEVEMMFPGPENAVLRSKILTKLYNPTISQNRFKELKGKLELMDPMDAAETAEQLLQDTNIPEAQRADLMKYADFGKAIKEKHAVVFENIDLEIERVLTPEVNQGAFINPDERLKLGKAAVMRDFVNYLKSDPNIDITEDAADIPNIFSEWARTHLNGEAPKRYLLGNAAGAANGLRSQDKTELEWNQITAKQRKIPELDNTDYVGDLSSLQMRKLGIKAGDVDSVAVFESGSQAAAEINRMETEPNYVPPSVLAVADATGRTVPSIIRAQIRLLGDTGSFKWKPPGSDSPDFSYGTAAIWARSMGMTHESAQMFTAGVEKEFGKLSNYGTAAEKYARFAQIVKQQAPTTWNVLKSRNATSAQKAAARRDLQRLQVGPDPRHLQMGAAQGATDPTNPEHVVSQMVAAGVPEDQLVTMLAIAMGEGMGGPQEFRNRPDTGDLSYGAFQINMIDDLGPARLRQFGLQRNEDLFDLGNNVRAAKSILDREGLTAWGAYNNKSYQRHMSKARKVVNDYLKKTGKTSNPHDQQVMGGKQNLQVIEYKTGDRSHGGYREDHGGGNYHEHIAFATTAQRDLAISMLEAQGVRIGSVEDGDHSDTSYHYKWASKDGGLAVDIPMPHDLPWTPQAEREWSQRIRNILGIR